MASYLIGRISVKDDTLWQEYVEGVSESLLPFKAKIVFRGKLNSVLAGKDTRDLVVVIEYDDQSTLDSWFNSEKYQSLIPIRDKAADVVITSYNSYPDPD